MRFNKFVLTGLTALASLGMSSEALANGRNPGSLLIYPEFDNRTPNLTLLTVTNTNTGNNPDGSNGTVRVEFVYIGRFGHDDVPLDCLEFNRTEVLTANDTLSFTTKAHNPQHEQGYVYAFAKNAAGQAIVFNYLIGNLLTLESFTQLEYSMNPVVFKGIGNGVLTDLDNDGIRDLDGVEYEPVTEEILIPRFIGFGNNGVFDSELLLLGLSGGTKFTTLVNFWIYNDNEEAFSAQYSFRCWDRVRLAEINGVFGQVFLKSTNHALNEIFVSPGNTIESGWMRVYGWTASSMAETIIDPAIYAVLVERIGPYGAADLPFESPATQTNGDLLPQGQTGDPSGNNNDNQ